MDYLKEFLEELTSDGTYYAEMAENIAELYISSEGRPAALMEFDGDFINVNLRCDMPSLVAANIAHDMVATSDYIVFQDDFFATEELGILYGTEATGAYFLTIAQALQNEQQRRELELDDALYVVKEPIYTFKHKHDDKIKKLWREEE